MGSTSRSETSSSSVMPKARATSSIRAPGRSRRYVTKDSIRRVWSMAFTGLTGLPATVLSAPPQPLATARSRSTTSARNSAGSSTTTSGPNSTSQASSPCPYGISNSSQPSPSSRTEVAFARRG